MNPTSIRIDRELLDALDKKAAEIDRPRNWVIMAALKDYVSGGIKQPIKPAPAKRKPKAALAEVFSPLTMVLPDCIPDNAWKEWISYKKESHNNIYKERGAKALIAQLVGWHQSGHDLSKIINDSIAAGYKGLFEPKGGSYASGQGSAKQDRFGAKRDEAQRAGETYEAMCKAGVRSPGELEGGGMDEQIRIGGLFEIDGDLE